jgi:hypothetical protein
MNVVSLRVTTVYCWGDTYVSLRVTTVYSWGDTYVSLRVTHGAEAFLRS